MSSQSAGYSDHTTRILALESVVSKISSSVLNNDDSLKQVLEGQNFMARLLMRCLNSEPGSSTPLQVPSSLQGLFGRGLADSDVGGEETLEAPLETPRDVNDVIPPPIVPEKHTASLGTNLQAQRLYPPAIQSPEVNIASAGDVEQGSWMSGSTVLITPSMGLGNPNLPRRTSPSAASTEICDSIRTPSLGNDRLQPFLDIYFGPDKNWRRTGQQDTPVSSSIPSEIDPVPASPSGTRVHTRLQSNADVAKEKQRGRNVEKIKLGNLMLPRISSEPIACNKACYILHPDFPDTVVAEGRSGGSWKARTQKLGHLCDKGEQMVQVHQINKEGCKILFPEERQPFRILDEALVKKTGSAIYVKWNTRYLVRNLSQ